MDEIEFESNRQNYQRNFIVGRTYLTHSGKRVKIIAEDTQYGPHYTAVQGDDGTTRVEEDPFCKGVYKVIEGSTLGWRYDRYGDVGRCTGGPEDNPNNLVAGSEQPEEDV